MVEAALDFFFDIINWVFTDFLIRIKILNISLLYYFLAILILGIVIAGLINTSNAGTLINTSSHTRRRAENKEMREAHLKRIRSK